MSSYPGSDYKEKKPDLVLVLPRPPSVNGLYKNAARGRVKTARYKNWIREAKNKAITQKINYFPDRVAVVHSIEVPDKRVRDCDNLAKALNDFLVCMNIVQDDKLIRSNQTEWLDWEDGYAKGNNVYVKIYRMGPGVIA